MIHMQRVTKLKQGFSLNIQDLQIQRGITLLVGKNGAGKSTLLHLLATASQPSSGKITYGGKTTADIAQIRREIGFLPSAIELYEVMTMEKFLYYMGELKGINKNDCKREVEELLYCLHLQGMHKIKLKNLSEGVKQRTAIAQALLGSPFFLFLDEPLTALDIQEKKSVIKYIGQHYAQKRLAVIVTHELNEWEVICDNLILLHDGEIVYSGNPTQWKYDTNYYVWEGILTHEEGEHLERQVNVINRKKEKDHVKYRIISKTPPNPSFQQQQPTLEDAYFIKKMSLGLSND
ncbi:ABC transporter ATP-binding protein [Evansella sp. AB-P1]|uniref:ABC transporter ATP-binding protein n=1 Tax=Evansella sp. AB-P1 TaxID=3037653 RepID=UPI00241E4A37|nr:ABC transporter ATP-binding protein [Evansella sp. AB-P1]MDG5788394.1 ABC transporter ATP-binding protein [Evansella sp. AB-P1]